MVSKTGKKTTAKKTTAKKTTAKKTESKKAAAKKTTAKKTTAKKTTAKKTVAKKTTAKKATAKKTAAKKTTTKKVEAKTTTSKKATAKKATVKKTTTKKVEAKATTAKKATAKKAPKPLVKEEKTEVIVDEVIEETPVVENKPEENNALNVTTKHHSTLSEQIPDIDPDAAKSMPGSALGIMGLAPYPINADEEYMNQPQREHFRKILQLWRHSLMEEVDRIVSHMQDESASFPDPNDRATQEEEFSLALRARDRERKLIRKINEALERIKEDDYGFCDSCGVEIGIRRLEARPTATLCIDCKTLDEIRERQMKQ